MSDDEFELVKEHVKRRMIARTRRYSLDELYGIPGRSTWRGLLEATQEYRGSEIVRSLIGWN